jgi:hypothetical protein
MSTEPRSNQPKSEERCLCGHALKWHPKDPREGIAGKCTWPAQCGCEVFARRRDPK